MPHTESIAYVLFIIFMGTALLSTVALLTRQSLLVAYILLGALLGPWGFQLVSESHLIHQTGDVGIIFLLFLLGLHLHPQNLWASLKRTSGIALLSSAVFFALGMLIGLWFGYTPRESAVIGAAMMFSSTIIGLKLLPTSVLHHQHTGDLMISVLLLQDLIAIGVLLILEIGSGSTVSFKEISLITLAIPILLGAAFIFEKYILIKLLSRFDRIQEYIFVLSIAWCLGMAELAHLMGLSEAIGAFIAGVAIATHRVSRFIAESLKPLRDFFLIMFFFSIGARFNFTLFSTVVLPACLLASLMLIFKPLVFWQLFRRFGEKDSISWELGVRLGQISEFSLLIVYLAESTALIGQSASYVVQLATILTFIVSSYWVTMCYPTPLSFSDKLQRD